jgi:hypothetical protein
MTINDKIFTDRDAIKKIQKRRDFTMSKKSKQK